MFPTNLVVCKPAFYAFYTSHLRQTVVWGTVLLWYRPRTECSFSQFRQEKLHSFNKLLLEDQSKCFLCARNYRTDHIIEGFHEDNSIISGLFQNCPKSPIAGSHFWQAPNLQCELSNDEDEWSKSYASTIIYVQSWKASDTRGILNTPASDVPVRLKTTCKAITIAREATNNQ